ncbi:PAS domain-containing sensor histidine kinase [Sphingobacterium corticibacter]|uniref:histidine kinase n=1 Tax=Sphingobacterium corticibacter TaxID=2171749 RepID=A0A2T8HEM2_9SPHI|nr:PAS domain-containing sensor histidine kinase [Sphingobacterium corticibacter]PVH23864.1 PAS domain-containing sensor histidine kinase [Sphingobacterium corticibacter]
MSEYNNALSKMLESALNASSNGIVITDNTQPDNPIIYCNQSFTDMTGYSINEIIGRNCRFLQKNDRNQEANKILSEAILKGEGSQIDIRNYRKDGSMFWNELTISPVYDQSGAVTHFVGMQNDVSRRKVAEQTLILESKNLEKKILDHTKELQEHEQFLKGIVETIRESLIVLDPDLRIVLVNKHFEHFFKVNAGDLKDEKLDYILDGAWNIPKLIDLLNNILPSNNPFEDFEVEHDFPYIGLKRLLLNASQITLDGTYRNWILLALENISEKYITDQKKEDFIAIASHEIKTPLTVVKGNLQLMQRMLEKGNLEGVEIRLQQSIDSLDNVNSLFVNLLEVSALASGFTQSKNPIKIATVIDMAINGIKKSHKEAEIDVSGNLDLLLLGDKLQLCRVINNILNNAIKYSGQPTVIKLHIGQVGNYAKVSITDFGIGIAKENQERIFDRFYRVPENEHKYLGTGLGLFISKQIVIEHGGNIWVESKVGHGSTFNLTIPLSI